MQLRYHELVGKEVVTAEGQPVGRLVDLVAEKRGEMLRVTALLVGPVAFLARFGLGWPPFRALTPRTLPIAWVDHIDDRIHLRPRRDGDDAAPP
jgi:sporulation protein YlmC with PRC-barrel domain